jgi:pilus assembly protein CpaB
MSKMRIVMFALAAGSAAMAAVLAKGMIGQKPEVTTEVVDKVKKVDVLVAAKDVAIGERMGAGAIVWKPWPEESVMPVMITREEQPEAEQTLAEFRAIVPMFEGETISEKKMVDPKNGSFMSAIVPKGMRAVSIRVSDRGTAGGFVMPNDRVDVIATKKVESPGGGGKIFKSETVMTNVKVLAINQTFRPAKEDEEVAIKGESATLEMTPDQAEVLMRVQEEGEGDLSLVLRSIAESDGKADEVGPQLTEKYRDGAGAKKRSSDTLFIRYGIETYATNN